VLLSLSVCSEVQIVCILSSWCLCIPKPHHLLPHLNPDWFYLSGTGSPRLSWKRGRETGVVAVAVVVLSLSSWQTLPEYSHVHSRMPVFSRGCLLGTWEVQWSDVLFHGIDLLLFCHWPANLLEWTGKIYCRFSMTLFIRSFSYCC